MCGAGPGFCVAKTRPVVARWTKTYLAEPSVYRSSRRFARLPMVKCVEEALSPRLRLGSRRVILGATSGRYKPGGPKHQGGRSGRFYAQDCASQDRKECDPVRVPIDWATVFSTEHQKCWRTPLGHPWVLDIVKTRFPARPDARWHPQFSGKVAHFVKVCIDLKERNGGRRCRSSAPKPKESKARSKRDILGPQPEIIRRR
jgi:hypothetical protein